jgi:transcriptional regulator with XRE-family HTH domain
MITLMHRNEDVSVKQSTAQELQQLLGGQLRQERIRQRLEQQEVAAGAGVARSALSRVENGKGGTIHTLVSIARALGRTDWLSMLSPQVTVQPMDLIRRTRKAPQRVRRSTTLLLQLDKVTRPRIERSCATQSPPGNQLEGRPVKSAISMRRVGGRSANIRLLPLG